MCNYKDPCGKAPYREDFCDIGVYAHAGINPHMGIEPHMVIYGSSVLISDPWSYESLKLATLILFNGPLDSDLMEFILSGTAGR